MPVLGGVGHSDAEDLPFMPLRRNPLKRLTVDELFQIHAAEYEIRDLWRKLGGTVCDCGRLAMAANCGQCGN